MCKTKHALRELWSTLQEVTGVNERRKIRDLEKRLDSMADEAELVGIDLKRRHTDRRTDR